MEIERPNEVFLQKARVSRAYLDAAKSFGIEQDIEFCPCLDSKDVEEYNNRILMANIKKMNNNNTISNGKVVSNANASNLKQGNIDSESIFKILAAAANISTNKNSNVQDGNSNQRANGNSAYNARGKYMNNMNNMNNNMNNMNSMNNMNNMSNMNNMNNMNSKYGNMNKMSQMNNNMHNVKNISTNNARHRYYT